MSVTITNNISRVTIDEGTIRVVTVGVQGPPGPSGPAGATGATGAQGPKGDPGTASVFIGDSPPSVSAEGEIWFNDVTDVLQVYANSSWNCLTQDDGYY